MKDGARRSGFVEAIFNCRKPSIAAINGPAVGVGITMTLPMDVRIAASGAKIGFIFARRGLVPEAGSAWFLPKLVGLPQALRWCISGRTFDADEALAGGLVCEVTEPADLLGRAKAVAQEMTAETSAVSVAFTRQMLWRFAGAPAPFELLGIDEPMSIERGATPMCAKAYNPSSRSARRHFLARCRKTCRASILGGRIRNKAHNRPTTPPPQTSTRQRRPSDARPVLQHPADPQTRRLLQRRHRRRAIAKAAQVGAEVLAAGGDCVDAVIATTFALGVLEPWMSGARRRRRDGALPCA